MVASWIEPVLGTQGEWEDGLVAMGVCLPCLGKKSCLKDAGGASPLVDEGSMIFAIDVLTR